MTDSIQRGIGDYLSNSQEFFYCMYVQLGGTPKIPDSLNIIHPPTKLCISKSTLDHPKTPFALKSLISPVSSSKLPSVCTRNVYPTLLLDWLRGTVRASEGVFDMLFWSDMLFCSDLEDI